MSDELRAVNNAAAHRFEVTMGDDVAFTEYRIEGPQIVLPHTIVPDAFKGRGVGGILASAALGYAREKGLKVVPLCSFIAGYIAKHPEYLDIVSDDYKAGLGG